MSSPSPEDSHPKPSSHSQSQSQAGPGSGSSVQATEQQLKARAEGVSIEDYLLPRSITLRLAKSVLPPNTSVQKDAVLAIQKAATVFVSYLSSHANEATLKRTVTPADVFSALSELELEGFRPRLEKELDKFSDLKAAKRRPRKSAENGEGEEEGAKGTNANANTGVGVGAEEGVKEVVMRGAKRVKKGGEAGGDGNGVVGREDEDEDDVDVDNEHEAEDDVDEKEEHDEDATEEEEEEDDDEEEEGGEGDAVDEDFDRVEDLDRDARARRMVDPDAGDDTESDDDGPGNQLRGDQGLG
ncbi:putative CBF/NF-Y family transcription factor [Aspergillus lucknowensis]|uniref:DNA polymerase epsilon subunit D n=1 Tax=Aspergillus lucknowensis TaxID=176173 RepID=A0ABR4M681_9EURO